MDTCFPITSPTIAFFVVLLIILIAPIVMSKLRIPHIVGMVLAGVIIGRYGLNILERDSSFELFGRVGLLYIIFLAGLEMDLEGLKKNIRDVGTFGLLTFLVPFVITYVAGVTVLHYSALPSLLLSCIMASNTLIAYPIVARYGLQKHHVTTLSVGASMIALFTSLVVVAAVVGARSNGGDQWWFWPLFAVKLVAYCSLMLYAIPRLTRAFLRHYSDSVMQYIFVLSMMFMSAAFCELIGLEGVLGAFFSGLILNRFIPIMSPLMSRIEFIGNALFIPYFLIGVGMLINIRLLMQPEVLFIVFVIVFVGTLGKALAAYISCISFRMSWLEGHLMFGLTSAHAAGSIAMAMIGVSVVMADGSYVVDDGMMNGIVTMILFTCILSTVTSEYSAKALVLREEKERLTGKDIDENFDDEKILIPVKYPETCDTLVTLAIMMRNSQLNRGLIALNVVYDDNDVEINQHRGQQLLEHVAQTANASDVRIQTQVRLATNIGNGIRHAFMEYDCSEIILGLHIHDNSNRVFWGEFAQSVFNNLSRQIIIARCAQPFNTLRAIQVVVPSRAEYEPGFYRWLERLCRLAKALECRIVFHATLTTLSLLRQYVENRHPNVRGEYTEMAKWIGMPDVAENTPDDNMLVVITARQGTVSYKNALDKLPEEITEHYHGKNLMIIFPDQYGPAPETFTFTSIQHKEQLSAYQDLRNWLVKLWSRL
ncbi:MAG: cation:proton antiporter [Prevotella sp.]|nr:cation:proton antiporter [Prevotella sp.]